MNSLETIKKQGFVDMLFQYIQTHAGIFPEKLEPLAKCLHIRNIGRKTLLIRPGERDNYINFIVRGAMRKFMVAGKKEITLQLSVEKNFMMAELSFFTGMPADCYIEAIEDTVVLSIASEELEELYEKIPELNRLIRLLIGGMYVRKEMRDLSLMRLSAKEKFLQFMSCYPGIFQRVPQKYIASYLQIKPETFSRLKHLTRQNRMPIHE